MSSSSTTAFTPPPPQTLFSSLSVNYESPDFSGPVTGSLQLVETDLGAANDLWHINVHLHWKPRDSSHDPVSVSIDTFLTLRLRLDTPHPTTTIYLTGGILFGTFHFPNGADSVMSFWEALRTRVTSHALRDDQHKPQLYILDKKPRMRRATAGVDGEEHGKGEEDWSSLLAELSISDGKKRERRKEGDVDIGRNILEGFAKVTQVARVVGEELSMVLDEEKRRRAILRREREEVARRRALDIYAEIVRTSEVERELPPRLRLEESRGAEVGEEAWKEGIEEGELREKVVMKWAIFRGGCAEGVRREVWPMLLGVFEWGEERKGWEEKEREYERLIGEWRKLKEEAAEGEGGEEGKECMIVSEQVRKDIVRTDREEEMFKEEDSVGLQRMENVLNVYGMYNGGVGYCQGMSDFLSPVLSVVEEESMAFWCLVGLMQWVEGNFKRDQSGMKAALGKLRRIVQVVDREVAEMFQRVDPDYYCCFRWILVWFKREFSFEDTKKLWEVMWTRCGGDELHLWVAAGLLHGHRRQLLGLPEGFDVLLRYINDMNGRIDVDYAIDQALMLHRQHSSHVK